MNDEEKIQRQRSIGVGLLGATGLVGQRFVQLLEKHPWFVLKQLAASPRSAGQFYQIAVNWRLSTPVPTNLRENVVTLCSAEEFDIEETPIIFSALDSSVAGPIEHEFAQNGFYVFSNAKNHRYIEDVPILIPYVNPGHLDVVHGQQTSGFIVTNANCSTTGLAIVLQPLHEAFGIEQILVFTMQAISGSGYPGVSGMDILDNVIPRISGEEPKLALEPTKILGHVKHDRIVNEDFKVSAHCNRVNVIDGHTECVSIRLSGNPSVEHVEEVLRNFRSKVHELNLPSAPDRCLKVFDDTEGDRPQPRLDRDLGNGFVVSVGRIRECAILGIKFCLLSHNTIIGAAGGSILNAELAVCSLNDLNLQE